MSRHGRELRRELKAFDKAARHGDEAGMAHATSRAREVNRRHEGGGSRDSCWLTALMLLASGMAGLIAARGTGRYRGWRSGR